MLLLVAAVLLQANPAEAFDAMRRTLEEARSLRWDTRAELKHGDETSTLTTSLRLHGGRGRLDLGITRGGTTREITLAWEGTTCRERDGTRDFDPEEAQPDALQRLQAGAARLGAAGLSLAGSAVKLPKRARNDLPDFTALRCLDFSGGQEENVGDRKALKVACRATLPDAGIEPFALTVWIDSERHVPLKRTIETKLRDRAVAITETTTRCDLHEAIPDAELSIPPRR